MFAILSRLERALLLLALVMLGLSVCSHAPLPTPAFSLRLPDGTLIAVALTPARLVGLPVAAAAVALVDSLLRDGPLAGARLTRRAPHWVLPALSIVAAFALYERLGAFWPRLLGAAGATGFCGFVVAVQMRALAEDPWSGPARLALNGVAYSLALGGFALVMNLPARSLLAAPLTGLAGALPALALLESRTVSPRRVWGGAALVGLMMAEVGWALGLGVLPPVSAAVMLLVVFYGLTGILQQHYAGRLQRRMLAEYAGLAVIALALLALAG